MAFPTISIFVNWIFSPRFRVGNYFSCRSDTRCHLRFAIYLYQFTAHQNITHRGKRILAGFSADFRMPAIGNFLASKQTRAAPPSNLSNDIDFNSVTGRCHFSITKLRIEESKLVTNDTVGVWRLLGFSDNVRGSLCLFVTFSLIFMNNSFNNRSKPFDIKYRYGEKRWRKLEEKRCIAR